MKNQTLMFVIIVFATLTFSALVVLLGSSNYESKDENLINTISPTPTASPEPKKTTLEVIVKPWNGETALAKGYGIKVEPSNPEELLFTDDDVSIRINVMSEEWVIQYAFFFSDLVEDKVEIPVVNSHNYIIDLKATFIINFYNVSDGEHRFDFCAVLHDGTKGFASIDFIVDTQKNSRFAFYEVK